MVGVDRYQQVDLYSHFDHFEVTLALFLTSEDDFRLLGELFGHTLDHVGDTKAIWGGFGCPLEGQNSPGDPATGIKCGSSVRREWVK